MKLRTCWNQGEVVTEPVYWHNTSNLPLLSLSGSVKVWFIAIKKKSHFKHSKTNGFSFAKLSSHIYENISQSQTLFTTTVVLGAAGFVLTQACVAKRYTEVYGQQTYPRISKLQKPHPSATFTTWKNYIMHNAKRFHSCTNYFFC